MQTPLLRVPIAALLLASWLAAGCAPEPISDEAFGAEIAARFDLTLGRSSLFQKIYLVTFFDEKANALDSAAQKALANEVATYIGQTVGKQILSNSVIFSLPDSGLSEQHHYVFKINDGVVTFDRYAGPGPGPAGS